jgi:hypothetical protein
VPEAGLYAPLVRYELVYRFNTRSGPARPGRLRALSVSLIKARLYGAFCKGAPGAQQLRTAVSGRAGRFRLTVSQGGKPVFDAVYGGRDQPRVWPPASRFDSDPLGDSFCRGGSRIIAISYYLVVYC